MKNIIKTSLAVGVLLLILITGCRKDTTWVIKPTTETVAITDTVSFTKVLVPIFSKNCAISGCHGDGGKSPVLSATKAYSSLSGSKYLNLAAPESSILYERLIGKLSPAMPMGKTTNPDNINALVLAWIKQGAKKN